MDYNLDQEYVLRVDPVTNLGLSAESVFSYHIAEIIRTKDAELPELLPIGYLVGDTMQIGICLKGKILLTGKYFRSSHVNKKYLSNFSILA